MVHLGLHGNLDCDCSSVFRNAKESSNDDSVESSSPGKHNKLIDFRDFQLNLEKLEATIQALKNETVDKLKLLEQEVKLNNQEQDNLYSVAKDSCKEEMQCKPVEPVSENLEEDKITNQEFALILLCIWGFYGMFFLLAWFG